MPPPKGKSKRLGGPKSPPPEAVGRGKQIDVIVSTLKDVAGFFSSSTGAVDQWSADGLPVREDGRYSLVAIYDWRHPADVRGVRTQRGFKKQPAEAPELGSKTRADADRRSKLAEAELRELKLAKEKGLLVRRDDVRLVLSLLSSTLRATGERMERTFGPEALELLNEGLDEVDRIVTEHLQSLDNDPVDI